MGQQAMVIEAIQAGARDFIVKPSSRTAYWKQSAKLSADEELEPFLLHGIRPMYLFWRFHCCRRIVWRQPLIRLVQVAAICPVMTILIQSLQIVMVVNIGIFNQSGGCICLCGCHGIFCVQIFERTVSETKL